MAERSCAVCQEFQHDDDERVGGPMLKRASGKPLRRVPGQKPPCKRCPKIPLDAPPFPQYAVELTPEVKSVIRHYYECAAVGEFPADPIVRRNAGIIAATLAEIENEQRLAGNEMMRSFIRAAVTIRGA